VEVQVTTNHVNGVVEARVRLRLRPRELNRLFVDGDVLIQLPTDGIATDESAAPILRTSVFLSELAEMRDGFARRFTAQAAADTFAASVRDQLQQAAARLGNE
jgi:hypothetical protein